MRNLSKEYKNRNFNYDKLLKYGFNKKDNIYIYEKKICDNYFSVIVEISEEKKISKVMDVSLNEEYAIVDVKDSIGNFVGKVKSEYEIVLNDIIDRCTEFNIFKSKQASEVIKYIKQKYNDDLEYLWEKFPDNAIWRNKDNKKWYGLLLTITLDKLGINSNEKIEVIDLRYQKNEIKNIIDNKKIFSGYHMNKNNWISIKLDESVDTEKIFELIDNSYYLTTLNK